MRWVTDSLAAGANCSRWHLLSSSTAHWLAHADRIPALRKEVFVAGLVRRTSCSSPLPMPSKLACTPEYGPRAGHLHCRFSIGTALAELIPTAPAHVNDHTRRYRLSLSLRRVEPRATLPASAPPRHIEAYPYTLWITVHPTRPAYPFAPQNEGLSSPVAAARTDPGGGLRSTTEHSLLAV